MANEMAAAEIIAKILKESFISPNELDSNSEPVNIVDGLFAVARAIDRLANK